MLTDILLVFAFILLNGLFAMPEIAIVTSRRVRLLQMAENGRRASNTHSSWRRSPRNFCRASRWVSPVSASSTAARLVRQRLRANFGSYLSRLPALAPHADTLALGIMVVLLTYVSLIAGELVPKRLALTHPERSLIARPMQVLATIGRPLVFVLSVSTDTILRLIGVRQVKRLL